MFSSIILFGSFFLFLALGVPIAFVLIVATVSYALLSTGDANLALVPQRIIYGINSFTMLCLPFFALAGNIMNHGGITMRLVSFRTGIRLDISRVVWHGRHPGMYDVWYSFRLGGSWYGGSWMPDDSGNEG